MYKIYIKKEDLKSAEKYARLADEYQKKLRKLSPETADRYRSGWHKQYCSQFKKKKFFVNLLLTLCKVVFYTITVVIYLLVVLPITKIKKIKEKKS